MSTPYQRGARFEYRIIYYLQDKAAIEGREVEIERSMGSKGPADIKVYWPDIDEWWFIQAKLHKVSLSIKEKEGLQRLKEKAEARKHKAKCFMVYSVKDRRDKRKRPIIWEELKHEQAEKTDERKPNDADA